MKKIILSLIILITACANAQTIKMKIPAVTPTAGEDVIAFQLLDSSGTTVVGGGVAVGRAKFEGVEIKKNSGPSAVPLFRKSTEGSAYPEVAFEFYDAANVLYYKVVLKEVYVSLFAHLSPECNGCAKLYNQVKFIAVKYELTDVIANITYRWNVAQNQSY